MRSVLCRRPDQAASLRSGPVKPILHPLVQRDMKSLPCPLACARPVSSIWYNVPLAFSEGVPWAVPAPTESPAQGSCAMMSSVFVE